MNFQTFHQLGPMGFDDSRAQIQLLGNGFGGMSFGNELEDFSLARTRQASGPLPCCSFTRYPGRVLSLWLFMIRHGPCAAPLAGGSIRSDVQSNTAQGGLGHAGCGEAELLVLHRSV